MRSTGFSVRSKAVHKIWRISLQKYFVEHFLGEQLRQNGDYMRHSLVFLVKVGYALSRGVSYHVVNTAGKEQRMKTIELEQRCDCFGFQIAPI